MILFVGGEDDAVCGWGWVLQIYMLMCACYHRGFQKYIIFFSIFRFDVLILSVFLSLSLSLISSMSHFCGV